MQEILTDPQMEPYASYFVSKMDLTQHPIYQMTIEEISENRLFHGYSLLDGINRLWEGLQDGRVYYPLYSEEEVKQDPKKGEAFFLYFPSMDPGASEKPFVVVVPGGGNVQLWNMTEGLPIAGHFNKLGYHAVVLNYRVGGPALYPAPLEDMAQLLRDIDRHQGELGLKSGRYFTVGFSAGGYLVNCWSAAAHGYQTYQLPKPEMNISVYGFTSWKHVREGWNIEEFAETTHGLSIKEIAQTDWNVEESVSTFPLTYILHGDDDHACDVLNSQVLADALKNAGIPHVLELGKGTDHGFGEGYFTPLRGWIERAVNYYEESVK